MPNSIFRFALLLSLAATTIGQACAAEMTRATQLLDECITQLHESKHSARPDQSVTLSQSCTPLYRNLHDPAFSQLDPPLRDETTFGRLTNTRRSLASIHGKVLNDIQLKRDGLNELLKSIYHKKQAPKSKKGWVDKVVDWLGAKYDEYFKHDNWFTRNFHFGKNLNQSTKRGLVNSLIVALILLVAFLVANELRAAGTGSIFRRRRKSRSHEISVTPDSTSPAQVNLNAISELPIHRQVPALLSFTLSHLIKAKLLPQRMDLTNREYLDIVREKLPGAGRDFEILVNQSELVVYGKKSLGAGSTGLLFENVRNIVQIRDEAKL